MLQLVKDKRSVDAKELAQHARGMLAKAFPGTRFGVTIKRYSGGSSVSVKWTDGPDVRSVETIMGTLEGKSFDGMDDSTHYHDVTLPTGEVVRAYSWIHADGRHLSPEALATVREKFAALCLACGVTIEQMERQSCNVESILYSLARKWDARTGVVDVRYIGEAEPKTSDTDLLGFLAQASSGWFWRDVEKIRAASAT
jgi:hypothetical protein